MAKGIADATTKIYDQLLGLPSDEWLRAVNAALTMLGETPVGTQSKRASDSEDSETPSDGFSEKGKTLIKKYKLDASILDEMFHIEDGKVELILAEAIGTSKREQTLNTYLLTGMAAFLESGVPEFSDATARDYCQHLGCYDSPNHSNHVKSLQNKVKGSKSAGWKLTAPGIKAAVLLIGPGLKDDE